MNQNIFQQFAEQLNETKELTSLRKKFYESFKKSKKPEFKYGLNIVLKPKIELETLKPKPLKNSVIEVKHGDNVIVKKLPSQLKKFITPKWFNEEELNQLFYYDNAFFNNSLFLKINNNSQEKITINTNVKDPILINKTYLSIGKNSDVEIIIRKRGRAEQYLSDSTQIMVGENSRVKIVNINNARANYTNQNTKIIQQENSETNLTDIIINQGFTKNTAHNLLNGKGSASQQKLLLIAKKTDQHDLCNTITHNKPNTHSNINIKGVLKNESKVVSRSLIKINENSENSTGYEKQEIILLSDDAEADTIPNLEINNNNVKCGHGASVGRVDEEKLFYLMSRGLNEERAITKIVEGFFNPTLKTVPNKEHLKKLIKKTILR